VIEKQEELLGRSLEIWKEIRSNSYKDTAESVSSDLLLHSDCTVDSERFFCIDRGVILDINIVAID
jgi:hypothetical protein